MPFAARLLRIQNPDTCGPITFGCKSLSFPSHTLVPGVAQAVMVGDSSLHRRKVRVNLTFTLESKPGLPTALDAFLGTPPGLFAISSAAGSFCSRICTCRRLHSGRFLSSPTYMARRFRAWQCCAAP